MRLTLNDVCLAIVDCEHKTASTQSEGHPSIRTPNIGRGRLILEGVNRVSDDTYQKWTQRMEPRPGDLILAREAPIGNVAIVPVGLKVCLGQRTVLIRADRAKVLPEYLVYLMLGDEIQGRIHSQSNGATVHHLNMKDIRGLELPTLPSMTEQRRIASILSAYDDLIENNMRRIAILQEMARRIYGEWFVRFRFPGPEKVQMVESELGLVPEGWVVSALGQLADVNARSVRRGAEPTEIRYVDISSVSTGSIDSKKLMLFADAPGRARRIVRDGDVIWACVRPNRKSYSLVVDPEPNLLVSTGFAVLSPDGAPSSFIYQCVTSDDFVSHLVNHAKGAAYPAVGAEDFETAKVLKPPNDLVKNFDRIADPMMRLVAKLQVKNANLRTTRDLLLPKLISGELDVSDMPEPEALAA